MSDLAARARRLRDLHAADELLVLGNAWDVVSARALAALSGAQAVASTSHGIAAAFGYEDGENIPLDLHLDAVARMARAVDLPLTMDFESGYGDPAETTRRAIEAGAAGGNLEDRMQPLDQAVAAVEASLRAARDAGLPDFVLNARTDAFLVHPDDVAANAQAGDDRSRQREEAITRCRAFLEAGAPVVFVPGVVDPEDIAALADALGRGVLSVVSVPGVSPPAAELQRLGVTRVSTGPFAQRAALTALQDAIAALQDGGVLPAGTRALN